MERVAPAARRPDLEAADVVREPLDLSAAIQLDGENLEAVPGTLGRPSRREVR